MITFDELGSLGRLGNQLFQYAAVRSLSLKCGYELALPDPKTKSWHGQNCLLRNFNIPTEFFREATGITHTFNEGGVVPHPHFFSVPDGTNLIGFYQSLYYFEEFAEIIRKELTPQKSIMEEANEFISSIREEQGKPVVSIHVRRGDNASINEREYGGMFSKDSDYFSYLKKAVSLFPNSTFLVFTGGKRDEGDNQEDIDWCKDNLGIDADYSNGTTIQDFSRMILCDHSILSPLSSFGWWAGYLGIAKNKKTVAPFEYNPSDPSFKDRTDFYPKEFILL